MNSCFEKLVDFKGIMSDGLDRIIASKKQCTFFNSIKITQKNVIFSWNTGVNLNLLIRQINLWKI